MAHQVFTIGDDTGDVFLKDGARGTHADGRVLIHSLGSYLPHESSLNCFFLLHVLMN
jgi:hypothetical protein